MKQSLLFILLLFAPFAASAETIRVDSVYPDVASVIGKDDFKVDFVLQGEGFDFLNEYVPYGEEDTSYVKFGPAWIAHETVLEEGTQLNLTIQITPKEFKKKRTRRFRLYKDGKVVARSDKIHILNPKFKKYTHPKTRKFFRETDARKQTMRTIGLNVHRGLDAQNAEEDQLYRERLDESETIWVREHVAYSALMGTNREGWIKQYDQTFARYKKEGRRVVAMLAYGDGDDPFIPPSKKEWRKFVRLVSKRWRNYIDAYEIWNEPDLSYYLHPNTVDAVLPLMKTGYRTIKHHDPKSFVLNGPIANIRSTAFLEELYAKGGDYFDELSLHVYYCDEHVQNGNLSQLGRDFQRVLDARPADRQDEGVWITELGCSTGATGVDETFQQRHLAEAAHTLLSTGKVRTILLYRMRNRPEQDVYEANFGLLDDNDNPRPAWDWYTFLPTE